MSTDPTPTPAEVIDCEVIPLTFPLRLGTPNFVASLKEVEGLIAKLTVTDAASMQTAADLQTRLTKAGVILEEARVKLNAPLLEQQRKINATAKGPADRIEAAKRSIKTALLAYNTRQQEIARKAEADRKTELARLERIRAEEQAKADEVARLEAERVAKEAPAAVPSLKLEDDTPTETEKAIEQMKAAPAIVAPKAAGLAFRKTLALTITDLSKVPDLFIERIAKTGALRATYCTGWKEGMPIPEVPGVAFEVKEDPVTR